MKLRILGSGTSTGVPEIGCECAVCTSADPRDKRLRASSLVHTDDGKVILIDCGPDFREQMLRMPVFEKIDGVLITHEHYDHVGGLDDLRPFCRFGDIPIYANAYTARHLRSRMPYCFVDKSYPGVPQLTLHEVEPGASFHIGETKITPLEVMHGKLPILGYRIGRQLGYVTDMTFMPEASYAQLHHLDLLVLNGLRLGKKHPTHQNIEEAVTVAERIAARQTYLIHESHGAGLHADLERMLQPQVQPAYDGMEVTLSP
ncbi:MAG: MBL fold metallo-hydrolase [Prevotellaceae bacterium]|jgi:phosphoribosyl 1,2-cyclic phosphate phosphodiesterase|nr:MBL fold metallo-hydrolase [Prevotellaceae bacterium]